MAIDATARVADGARIGDGVEVGPYCVVGPHVGLKAGVCLAGQVNVAGATTIGEATVVHPFASLGTSPQSVHYRGEPTQLVIGARPIDILEFFCLTPLPGSEDHKKLHAAGVDLDPDLNKYDLDHI